MTTGDAIASGSDTFLYDQDNSETHSLVATTTTDTGTDLYTLFMSGTETDGTDR
jgi:hypothetical protein